MDRILLETGDLALKETTATTENLLLESFTYEAAASCRTNTIAAESRTYEIAAENRTFEIDC